VQHYSICQKKSKYDPQLGVWYNNKARKVGTGVYTDAGQPAAALEGDGTVEAVVGCSTY
jgi:hypothetical protein